MAEKSGKAAEVPRRIEELQEYFEKGKQFTEELLKDNERLRFKTLQLEKEQMELQANEETAVKIEDLESENEKLRSRLEKLLSRYDEVVAENEEFAERYVNIQAQNDNLLNLYVASYQLHATLIQEEVVRVIHEIILNLIGAEEFYVYLLDEDRSSMKIVAGEGPDGPISGEKVDKIDLVIAKVLAEGEPYFKQEGDTAGHLACTPLKARGETVGAISITKLMDQKKEGFTAIDFELLSLLADHAATALVSSSLYGRTERKLKTVENFLNLIRDDGLQQANK